MNIAEIFMEFTTAEIFTVKRCMTFTVAMTETIIGATGDYFKILMELPGL